MSHTNKIKVSNSFMNYSDIELNLYDKNKNEDFVDEKPISGSIIYGHNGSGKSSIARALKNFRNKEHDPDNYAQMNNGDLKDGNSDYVFVYDNEFINSQIDFTSQELIDDSLIRDMEDVDSSNKTSNVNDDSNQGLDAIVMIDDQDEINKNLREVHKEIYEIETLKQSIEIALEKTRDKTDENSPEFWVERIMKTLKEGKVGWAALDKEIKNNKVNSSVNISVIERLVNNESKIDKATYEILNKHILTLHSINKEQRIKEVYPINKLSTKFEKNIDSVLAETVEKPKINKEGSKIIEILTKEGNNFLCHSVELLDKGYSYCPTCLRELHNPEEIKERIINVLKEQGETDLKKKIEGITIPDINKLSADYEQFDNYQIYEEIKKEYVNLKEIYEEDLNKKLDNLYQPMKKSSDLELLELQNQLSNTIKELNKEVKDYNKKFDEKKVIENTAKQINDKLAQTKIKADYKKYIETKEIKEKSSKKLNELNERLSDLRDLERKALDDFKNVELALSDINNNLAIIYLHDGKIELVENGGLYKVKINEKIVALNRLSTGQKNAIALAYFFSTIHEGDSIEDKYKNEIIVVLDDPISSFDYNNRIGVFTFLRYQFKNIFEGCSQSKVIILTHDSGVAYNLCKIFEDLEEQRSSKIVPSNIRIRYQLYQLSNTTNDKHFIKTKPEESLYTSMFQSIYLFATENLLEDKYTISIGNNMRRILEGFATFNYKTGITGISNDEEILNQIKDEDDREFYQSFMYRFILHGESHTEEIANHILESNINELDMNMEDKIKIAQKFIYFMYILNPLHVAKHLNDKNSNCKEHFSTDLIESWKPNITSDMYN